MRKIVEFKYQKGPKASPIARSVTIDTEDGGQEKSDRIVGRDAIRRDAFRCFLRGKMSDVKETVLA